MRNKAAVLTVLGIVAVSILLLAAGGGLKERWSRPAVREIIFIPKSTDFEIEFWAAMNQGVAAAAEEFGANVTVLGTREESDVDGQIRLLKEAAARRPDAIVLAATDYHRVVPAAKEAAEAGIRLVTVDSGLNERVGVSFVATDNVEAGRQAGSRLAAAMEGEGKAVILSVVQGSATAMEREQGIRESLAEHSKIRLERTYYSGASEEKAYDITKTLLSRQPGLKGIAALNEPTTIGAARAIRDLGSRAKLVGFDNSLREIAFLEEGVLEATITQKPFNMGYLGVRTAIAAIEDEKVPPEIDTGSVVITRDNMFDSKNLKLLFPFTEDY